MRQAVQLNTSMEKGGTKRQHIESAIKQLRRLGVSTAELEQQIKPVELMTGTEYLVQTFGDLSRSRPHDLNGPCPITHTEIKAYCELMDEKLDRWEVTTIKAMDAAFLDETAKQAKE